MARGKPSAKTLTSRNHRAAQTGQGEGPTGADITSPRSSKSPRAALIALASLVAITLASLGSIRWTNFGGVDEWLVLSLIRQGIFDMPHANRPLNLLWFAPAALLTPGRFEGFIYLHLSYLALSGWLTWLLVRRLEPGVRALAFLAAAFAIAWAPADVARLEPNHTMNSGATFATFAALVLFLESWQRQKPVLLAVAVASAFVAARSYEATIGLLAAAPLLFLVAPAPEGGRSPRRVMWALIWEAGVAIQIAMTAYPLLQNKKQAFYQTSFLGFDANPAHYLGRLARQYWLHLAPLLDFEPKLVLHFVVAVALLVFIGAALATGSTRCETVPPRRRLAIFGLVGLGLAGFGYSMLVLSSGVKEAARTQFLSTPGIGLFLAAAILLLVSFLPSRVRGLAAIAIGALVIALGTGRTLAMQRQWDRISFYDRQRNCLVALLQKAPALKPGTLLLLMDRDGTWPQSFTFRHAARLAYGDSVTAHLIGGRSLFYDMVAGPSGIDVTPWPVMQGPWRERATHHSMDQIVVFRLAQGTVTLIEDWPFSGQTPEAEATKYAPRATITNDPPPPSRRVLD